MSIQTFSSSIGYETNRQYPLCAHAQPQCSLQRAWEALWMQALWSNVSKRPFSQHSPLTLVKVNTIKNIVYFWGEENWNKKRNKITLKKRKKKKDLTEFHQTFSEPLLSANWEKKLRPLQGNRSHTAKSERRTAYHQFRSGCLPRSPLWLETWWHFCKRGRHANLIRAALAHSSWDTRVLTGYITMKSVSKTLLSRFLPHPFNNTR